MKTETFHGQKVEILEHIWKTFVFKPVYGHTVYINEKLVKAAKKAGVSLIVESPGASKEFSPAQILLTGKKIEKEFKIPGKPMILFKLDLDETI